MHAITQLRTFPCDRIAGFVDAACLERVDSNPRDHDGRFRPLRFSAGAPKIGMLWQRHILAESAPPNMNRLLLSIPLLGLGLPGCLLEETFTEDDDAVGQTSAELTGTVNPVDCGFYNGKLCKSTSPLGHNVQDTVLWDPCLGGSFKWTAFTSFKSNDRACLGGEATAGYFGGCSGGGTEMGTGAYSGSGFGATTLSVATNGWGSSNGINYLFATCDEPLYVGVFKQSSAGSKQAFVNGLNLERVYVCLELPLDLFWRAAVEDRYLVRRRRQYPL